MCRPLRSLLPVAVLVGGVFLGAPAEASDDRAVPCGGVVFRDLDADGDRIETLERDATPDDREGSVAGVRVAVTDRHGEVHRDRTSAAGVWSVSLTADDYPVRIEFTVPDGHAAGRPGPHGGSIVQVASAPGDCHRMPTGNLGLAPTTGYCAEQPDIAVACHTPDDHPDLADQPAISAVANTARDNGDADGETVSDWMFPASRPLATIGEIGTVFGLATAPDGSLFAGAFTKRHTTLVTDLNPDGNPTAIYRVPRGGEPELFVIVDPTAPDPHEVGDDDDLRAMNDVFVTGLGDLEISPDGSTLFTVDLGRRELVSISVADGSVLERHPLDGSALGRRDCRVGSSNPSGDLRAFGLGWDGDDLLVGVVCSAASTVVPGVAVAEEAFPGPGGGNHGWLQGYVYGFDGEDFTERLSWPLAADRGDTQSNGLRSNDAAWHPWKDVYPFAAEHEAVSYPQPVVSDLLVDERGDLVVALADRWSHQTAPMTIAPSWDGTPRRITESIAAGDLQRACQRDGNWVIEGSSGCQGGFGNGWEFFDGESYGWHAETALGGLTRLPGRREVVVTQMNPRQGDNTWRSGGLVWHGTDDGERGRGVRLYDGRHAEPEYTFEQAAGMGGLAVLCGGPPRSVGGTIWDDVDADGVRDPTDGGIEGIAVELRSPQGKVLSADLTDEHGRYGFDHRNVPDGLVDGVDYEIVLADRNYDPAHGILAGAGAHSGMVATLVDAGERDDLDSDAVVSTDDRPQVVHRFEAGDWTIDHTRDIGLRDRYDLAVESRPGPRMRDDGVVAVRLEIRNEGSLPSGAFTVRADLPAETSTRSTGVPSTVETSITADSITWAFDESQSVPPGSSLAIDLVLQVNDSSLTSLNHAVEIIVDSGDDEDSTPGDPEAGYPEDDHDELLVELFGITGTIWMDLSGAETDQVRRGAPDVAVALFDPAGNQVGGATTDADGRFLFDALAAGSYRVGIPDSEFGRDGTLRHYDRVDGATSSSVQRMLAESGHVTSEEIRIGAGVPAGDTVDVELRLEREAPRPVLDLVVVLLLVPTALGCIGWLLYERRRHLGVAFARGRS